MIPIDYNFTSKINELEDTFLGSQVGYNVFVERLFIEEVPPKNDEGKFTYKEISRISDLSNYDYMEDVENGFYYTKINYDEIDYADWNYLLYNYRIDSLTQTFNEQFERIDDYLANENIDLVTKSFSFEKLLRKIISCQSELEEQLTGTLPDKTLITKSKYQQSLIEMFIEFYKDFANRMQSSQYAPFLKNKTIDLEESPLKVASLQKSKKNLPQIEEMEGYKKLREIDFINELNDRYIDDYKKIIATLLRCEGFFIKEVKAYYVFCDKVGLIQKLENTKFRKAKDIGAFLADLSGFKADTLKHYYSARNSNDGCNPHFPFTVKAKEELQHFFEYTLEIRHK